MKVDNNFTLRIVLEKLVPHRLGQIVNQSRCFLYNFELVLQIHVQRKHVPAVQSLPVIRFQVEWSYLTLYIVLVLGNFNSEMTLR
jgi:hypothetical protein